RRRAARYRHGARPRSRPLVVRPRAARGARRLALAPRRAPVTRAACRSGCPAAIFAAALLTACAVPRPAQISASGVGAYEVSLAVHADEIAVAWYDERDGNAEIYLQWLDRDARPRGPAERLTDDPEDSYEIDLAPVGRDVAAAWYDKDAEGALRARLGLWRREGGFAWRVDLSPDARGSRNPVVRAAGERLFSAWIERRAGRDAVLAAGWDAEGRMLSAPVELGPASATTWNLNAAIDASGTAHVVFDAAVGTAAEELYLARLEAEAVSLTRLTADDGFRSKYPDLAFAGEHAALTWFDERDGNREVYLAVGPATDLGAELEVGAAVQPRQAAADRVGAAVQPRSSPPSPPIWHARRVTDTPGESIGAYLAWNGERIGLAWSDASTGPHDVYFQPFDAEAAPLAPPRRI